MLLLTTITCNGGKAKKKMLPFPKKPITTYQYLFILGRNMAEHVCQKNIDIASRHFSGTHIYSIDDFKLNFPSWKAEISTAFKTTSSLKDSVSTCISSQPFDLTLASVGHLQNDDESKSKVNKVRTKWMPHYGSALLHQFCKR